MAELTLQRFIAGLKGFLKNFNNLMILCRHATLEFLFLFALWRFCYFNSNLMFNLQLRQYNASVKFKSLDYVKASCFTLKTLLDGHKLW